MPNRTVNTETGLVRGVPGRDGVVFRNIPYAAISRRFAPPVRAEAWTGVRNGSIPGQGAIQPWVLDDPWNGYFNPVEQGEDCLTLQVHTPDPRDSGLPVAVWIHGGGFMTGAGTAPAHGGRTYARDGIVHVAINYRMAIDGYTLFADSQDAENLGLRDQIAALEWVQRNIHAFGGDPGEVTVMGQSAGGISVAFLMASPMATGLFHRAVIQSGAPQMSFDIDTALESGRQVARLAGRAPTCAAMATLDADSARTVMATAYDQATTAALIGGREHPVAFSAVHGTPTLPMPVIETLATSTVPLLIGTTSDEAAGSLVKAGLDHPDFDEPLTALLPTLGITRELVDVYQETRKSTAAVMILNAALSDRFFRMPSLAAAEAHPGRTYVYEFTWESALRPPGMGADHTFDIPFAQDDFQALRKSGPIGDAMLGPNPPQSLADAMHGAFVRFVKTGDPGWPGYDRKSRATMRFDEASEVVPDLAGEVRRSWNRR